MRNILILITSLFLSIASLAGCQSSQDKMIQGEWKSSLNHQTFIFNDGTMQVKYIDGSGGEYDYHIDNIKDNRNFSIIKEKAFNSGTKAEDHEIKVKMSKDGKTMWDMTSGGDYFYEKVE
ncbi:Uncharacterised protein [Macrococcoides caseolyticum]|uniref:hypothetical protein n=1 Tax=Macrococcoides caseolyticum TaxID=69966 RepID=UPI000E086258|nr:hypothetical protein [Macrococcus caseolyticus]STY75768.1 Uncharacterised protein [Macrococcus caseolyticus]